MQNMQNMQKIAVTMAFLAAALSAAHANAAVAQNVALNKAVTLDGKFEIYGWDGANNIAGSTITNGAYLAEATQWDKAVWWDGTRSIARNNSILIDLGGRYSLTQFALQGDNNDNYRVEYYANGAWQTAWQANAVSGYGLTTRTSSLLDAIVTDKLRISGAGGDGLYSVAEFQAIGVAAVPEPASYAMLMAGLGLVGFAARRKKSARFD